MRTSWREVELDDVATELTVGHVGPMVTEYRDRGVPFIRSTDIEPFRINRSQLKFINPEFHAKLKKSALRPGDVVIVRTGKPGTAAVIPVELPDANCSDVVIVRTAPDLDPHYLVYFVNSSGRAHVNAHSGGAVQQHFNVGAARRIRMNLPPIEEQREIVDVLGALDDKIELNRRMNDTLVAVAQAVFKEWFVDGVKEEWEVKTMREACDIFDSKRVPLSNREREKRQGPYPYYGAASVMDYVDDFLFDGIHILMGEDGSVLNTDGTPVLQYVWGKMWVNNHAHVLTGKGNISTEHLLLALKEVQLAPYVTGAVQMKLNQGNLFKIPFLVPPPDVCKAFNDVVGPLYAKLRANTEESRTLTALRDTLLPKLMRGEVRVKGESISAPRPNPDW